MIDLTNASLDLFKALVKDSGNWAGTPLIYITPPQRGNLTDLKKAGLLTTFRDDDSNCTFADFTPKGIEFAREIGMEVRGL